MASTNTKTHTPKISRLPKDYEMFLIDASIYAMDLLEEDEYLTLDEAIAETVGLTDTWIGTPKGIALVTKHTTRLALAATATTASAVPEGEQGKSLALAAVLADLRHELVEECGLDASLFE
jgi:hypothetical protein